jgi:hypothetical protein
MKPMLADLEGIGPAMLRDFALLKIDSVAQLAKQDPQELYDRLCAITKSRQDPCVLDVFHCAVAQARDPLLPEEQRKWWWWSRKRRGDSGQSKRARRMKSRFGNSARR